MNSGLAGRDLAVSAAPAAAEPAAIRAWLLLGKYGGDNAQVLALGDHLAETLGWQCETRRVRFHPDPVIPRARIPMAIDFGRSESFDLPWPDAVISCGRFYGAVAQWLRRRAGSAIVHVHFGRILSPMRDFDLLAATAQYGLPEAENLLPLTFPLAWRSAKAVAAATAAWQPRLAHLPRPWIVMLVGGPAPRISFGAAEARGLLARATALASAKGGSLIGVFGRRTPGPVRDVIREGLAAEADLPNLVLNWPPPEPNPYPALLALADRFLVTADSASMIADACMTGTPVELYRLPVAEFVNRFSTRGLGLSIDARRRRRGRAELPADPLDRLRDLLVRRNWMRPWDDIRDYFHRLDRAGLLAGPEAGASGNRAREIQSREIALLTGRLTALVAEKRKRAAAARL